MPSGWRGHPSSFCPAPMTLGLSSSTPPRFPRCFLSIYESYTFSSQLVASDDSPLILVSGLAFATPASPSHFSCQHLGNRSLLGSFPQLIALNSDHSQMTHRQHPPLLLYWLEPPKCQQETTQRVHPVCTCGMPLPPHSAGARAQLVMKALCSAGHGTLSALATSTVFLVSK